MMNGKKKYNFTMDKKELFNKLENINEYAHNYAYNLWEEAGRLEDEHGYTDEVEEKKILAMADCANLEDGKKAISEGAEILRTTLSGYAYQKVKNIAPPDLTLVKEFSALKIFTMAEGRYNSPELARNAMKAGANSVTVGSAIKRIEHITNWFKKAIETNGG